MSAKVVLASNCGFCVGVKNAVELVEKALSDHRPEPVYSLGMFIHNPQEIERLAKKGLRVVTSIEDVPDGSLIVLPSHGTPPKLRNQCKEKRLRTIDLICVYVRRLQEIALHLHKEGFSVVMVGDKDHPEVLAVQSLVPGLIVVDKEDVLNDNLSFNFVNCGVISQTTQSLQVYKRAVERLVLGSFPRKELRIFNTICWDVLQRQEEVVKLAKECDLVLVIGGKESANTRRLYEIAREYTDSYHLSVPEELTPEMFKEKKQIGIISGTSTPNWLVAMFKERIEEILKKSGRRLIGNE